MSILPNEVVKLLRDRSIKFIGHMVGGDVAKIERDFCFVSNAKKCELDGMAKRRGYVGGRQKTLSKLAELVLGVDLDKNIETRLSKWGTKDDLTQQQIHYAALDVVIPLQIFECLLKKPDLTMRLLNAEVEALKLSQGIVDVVPVHGSQSTLSTRVAVCRVVPEYQDYKHPSWCSKFPTRKPSNHLVVITDVYAKNFVVPTYRKGEQFVTLSDFGDPPFELILPVKALAPHHVLDVAHDVIESLPPPDTDDKPNQGLAEVPSGDNVANGIAVESTASFKSINPKVAMSKDANLSAELPIDTDYWTLMDENFVPSADEIALLRAAKAVIEGSAGVSPATQHLPAPPDFIPDK